MPGVWATSLQASTSDRHSSKYPAMIWPWTSSNQPSNSEAWRILSEEERQSRIAQLLVTVEKSRTLSSVMLDQLDGLMELYTEDTAHHVQRNEILTKVVEGRRLNPGINHHHLTDSMLRLVCWFMEQTEWAKAEGTALELIQWCRRGSSGSTKEILTKIHLCDIYIYQERWSDAERVLRWMLKKTVGEFVESMANEKLARTLLGQGRHGEARTILDKLIASTRKNKEFYWIFLTALCSQGEVYLEQGSSEEASRTFQSVMTELDGEGLVKDRWGRTAPLVCAIQQLAMAFIRANKKSDGVAMLKAVLEKDRSLTQARPSLPILDFKVVLWSRAARLRVMSSLAQIHVEEENWTHALPLLEEWVHCVTLDAVEGRHVDAVELEKNAHDLIEFLVKSERLDEVVRVWESLIQAEDIILGPAHEKTIQSRTALAKLFRSLGRMLEWQELRFKLL